MSSSTLPFLLKSILFKHCFFHCLNVFSTSILLKHANKIRNSFLLQRIHVV
uniref:Uncharacterized protein n=1 Tax=Anguilla anguilla TaxID=7936 RepID=A0A0E9QLQ9_ANGAN